MKYSKQDIKDAMSYLAGQYRVSEKGKPEEAEINLAIDIAVDCMEQIVVIKDELIDDGK